MVRRETRNGGGRVNGKTYKHPSLLWVGRLDGDGARHCCLKQMTGMAAVSWKGWNRGLSSEPGELKGDWRKNI